MGRQIGNHTTETGGTQTLGNGKVVLFPARPAMQKDKISRDSSCGLKQEPSFRELLADLDAAFAQSTKRLRDAYQTRRSITRGEAVDFHPVGRGFREKFSMIIHQLSAGGARNLDSAPEDQRDDDDGNANRQTAPMIS